MFQKVLEKSFKNPAQVTHFCVGYLGWMTVLAPLDVIPLHLRGGIALPLQLPGKSFTSLKGDI